MFAEGPADAKEKWSGRRFLNDRLDWNLLRTYLAISQEGSISRAAARLFITQSAVSQSLKRLEEQLDCALILRRGPRFHFTPVGEEVLRIAEEIYGNVSRLASTVEEPHDEIVGKVRLLSISQVQSAIYDDFLSQFHSDHPHVELEIEVMRSSDIQSSLSQKTATAGVGLCRFPQPKLEQQHLMRQRYAFFCGKKHRLFGQRRLSMDALKSENFVSFTSDQIGGNLSPLTVFRDQQGFTGKIVASSSSFEEIRRLIIAGYGIGCLPEHLVDNDLHNGLIWRLPPAEGVADVDVYLLWNREQRMSRAERVFLEALRQAIAHTPD
ncbi:DNA-binding transcriptional regulator, LysR family [Pseudomonas flavescens]|uniref:DNA-binding transcriptional regulator, LysR family n=1 Tax=Phytopseudomonas flavescens TaxID=29435 RepID=A0A1G8KBF5_9GAMM|nr:LysR family transcriptional regulator [Pseudomonas flavescens]SDI40758.1 DNA-binding transcriptional regulator, LysR family [Pseudomonas flavescens]